MQIRTNRILLCASTLSSVVILAGCPTLNILPSPPRVTTSMVRVGDATSLTVQFTANGLDPDGGTTRYLWDFKDGTILAEQNPSHAFSTPGFRQIDLTVTDDEGQSTRVQLDLSVPLPGDGAIAEREVANEGSEHVPVGTPVPYSANPPASGAHYSGGGIAPTAKGFYEEVVPPEVWVHNLEHGDVVVLYDCIGECDPVFLNSLRSLTDAVPPSKFGTKKIVITRYPGLSPRIMAVAWDVQLDFASFDQAGLVSFYQRHVSQGPEDEP